MKNKTRSPYRVGVFSYPHDLDFGLPKRPFRWQSIPDDKHTTTGFDLARIENTAPSVIGEDLFRWG